MNTQINPRTFTDQIPAYREKTRFLVDLGRQDLADIHDYFFYKRLLLFYNQLKERKLPDGDKYLHKITDIIYKDRERIEPVFTCPAAAPGDRRRAALFLKSPARYWRKVKWEQSVVIPCKAAVKTILRRMTRGLK